MTLIDSCQSNNGGCEHNCRHSPGGAICSCRSGYALQADGRSCEGNLISAASDWLYMTSAASDWFHIWCMLHLIGFIYDVCCIWLVKYSVCWISSIPIHIMLSPADVDECETGEACCRQTCYNTPGSYSCGCKAGFILSDNRCDCNDVDECLNRNGGCSQRCINSVGSFECVCYTNYRLADDGMSCEGMEARPPWLMSVVKSLTVSEILRYMIRNLNYLLFMSSKKPATYVCNSFM